MEVLGSKKNRIAIRIWTTIIERTIFLKINYVWLNYCYKSDEKRFQAISSQVPKMMKLIHTCVYKQSVLYKNLVLQL